MNGVEQVLRDELGALLDRVAAAVPKGAVAGLAVVSPTLRARLDDAEARLAQVRASLLCDYGRWCGALDDLENLWALASWRVTASEEPAEQTPTLAA